MRLCLAVLALGFISTSQLFTDSGPSYTLRYGTYVGGHSKDGVNAIAVDSDGNAYVGGQTLSPDFPSTRDAFLTKSGIVDSDYAGFISKLNRDGKLVFSTFLRGNPGRPFLRTFVNAVTVDGSGNAYAVGSTCSTDFPTTPEAFQQRAPGPGPNLLEPCDAFVAKLDRTGSRLLYATYLGGTGSDSATSIWLDAQGNAYVGGYTSSGDFPVTQDAAQHRFGGGIDGFVVILDSQGRRLHYGTFLGGHERDEVAALTGDSQGNLYVTGATRSNDFPGLEHVRKPSSDWDAFLLKITAGTRRLSAALQIGGSGGDAATSIALGQNGDVYVAGWTTSRDFPCTPNALGRRFHGGKTDAFWVKAGVGADNRLRIEYSSLLGGRDDDRATAIGTDEQGSVFIAGNTASSDFPITRSAFHARLDRNDDGFLVKIRRDGAQIQFATYIGGGHNLQAWKNDGVSSLAIGRTGDVYIAGGTTSHELPVTAGSVQSHSAGNMDGFVLRLGLPNATPTAVREQGGRKRP